jgi:DNA-directed RNA polymerase sigma subunit (sigma70/sigma32)
MRMGLVDGHPHTLTETAEALGLSLADAKDIEARAMEHLREVVPLDKLAKLLED